jgi:hypothetical protein
LLQVVGMYRKLGFRSDVDGIKGMAFQRKGGPKDQLQRAPASRR